MSESAVFAGLLLALSLAAALQALRCLSEHLLASALIYTMAAAALAGVAGKLAIDAL